MVLQRNNRGKRVFQVAVVSGLISRMATIPFLTIFFELKEVWGGTLCLQLAVCL